MDTLNYKLLRELDLNCRQSLTSLSKKLGVVKQKVAYRIERLETLNTIQSYGVLLNLNKLGYSFHRLFLKYQNTTPKVEQEIIEYLHNSSAVSWFIEVNGSWDINIMLCSKQTSKIISFWNSFKDKFNNHIYAQELSLVTKSTYYSKAYLLDDENYRQIEFIQNCNEIELSSKDYMLLKELTKNSRQHIIDLAKLTGYSVKTVSRRIKYFQKEKIILGFIPLLNISTLGYTYRKIHLTLKNTDKNILMVFKEYVLKNKYVVYSSETLGGASIELDIHTPSTIVFNKFLKELKNKFHAIIQHYELMEYGKEHKYISLPED